MQEVTKRNIGSKGIRGIYTCVADSWLAEVKCLHHGLTELSSCSLRSVSSPPWTVATKKDRLKQGRSCLVCGQVSFYVLNPSVYELGQSWPFPESIFVILLAPLHPRRLHSRTWSKLPWEFWPGVSWEMQAPFPIVSPSQWGTIAAICLHDSTPIQHKFRQWIPRRDSVLSDESFKTSPFSSRLFLTKNALLPTSNQVLISN